MEQDRIEIPAGEIIEIPIFYTNDLHGEMENFARIATILRKKKKDGDDFLLLDAGDFASGTAAANTHRGQPMVDLINITGYDAIGLGEGEFAFNLQRFKELLQALSCPVVCANLYSKDGTIFPGVRPFVIKRFRDIPFGITGFIHPQIAVWARERAQAALPGLDALEILELQEVLSDLLEEMKRNGAQRFIFLSHLGMEQDVLLAEKAAPDVIVSGHSHDHLSQPIRIKDTLIVSSGSGGRYLGSITLSISDVISMRISRE